MKPLRDSEPTDPIAQRAALLVSSVGPLPESRLRMRRVRLALDRSSRAHRPGFVRRSGFVRRLAVVLALVFGAVATAGATWGVVRMVSSVPERSVLAPVTVRGTPAQPARATRAAPTARVSVGKQRAATTDDMPVVALEAERSPPARVAHAQRPAAGDADPDRHADAERHADPARVLAKQSDSVLVHDAVKELRNGGDAAEAAALLERYRSRNPDGILAEEALALSIEAAVQSGDPSRKQLARQYLAKYPKGRFASAARRAAR